LPAKGIWSQCESIAEEFQVISSRFKFIDPAPCKLNTYTDLQTSLNRQGVSSYVELIWPLPGETLCSFQESMGKLCEIGADSFVVYPLLLMNNVELGAKQAEYGLVTSPDPDPLSEAEIVIAPSEVDTAAYPSFSRTLDFSPA
jgi:hypothetical protein